MCVSVVAEDLRDFIHFCVCKRGVLRAVGHYWVNISVSLLVSQWHHVSLCEHECKI